MVVALTGFGPIQSAHAAEEVNVYSYRQEVLLRPLLEAFTEETGIEVNLVSGKADALLERLKNEGQNSPADILLTVDAGRLHRAEQAGLLQPVTTPQLRSTVPPQYQHPDGYWYGLSVRARPIFYARDRVSPEELSTYEALTDEKWKERICVRSSNNIYNQSLLASLIAHDGAEATEAWTKGFVANLARKPQGGDRDQLHAVAAGQCDLALANTYYLGQLMQSGKANDRAAADKVAVFWPNQDDRGVHVNISGAGVTKSAENRDNAIRFLEFLVSDRAQKIYTESINEYPVKDDVPWSELVASWGQFKADHLNLSTLGENNAEAVRIADRAGWR
ncbi:MAG: Fe(3+) ABC transporter substrate-binding protein [Alphaproteobacteria bacterium]|nr:Fe(3+) ABC transporter substrate-binding protein [Alphaproteobacteria bacterium]